MVMIVLGSVLIGLALAYAATRWLPQRLAARPLVLSTGPAAALLGALLIRAVLGPDHRAVSLLGAVAFAVVSLSLLVRPTRRFHRSATA